MKSKWHIPLSSKDPGYQKELARCMFFNKQWDQLTEEEKARRHIPSLWDQKYSPSAQMQPGAVVVRKRGRLDETVYGIPFPAGTHEYTRAVGACRFFRKKWIDLTEEQQQWNPVIRQKTTQETREQKVGFNQPIVVGNTIGKEGCSIGTDGIVDSGTPKVDGMMFDSRLQRVKKNCQDLCYVTDLITTLVKSQRERVDITRTMANELHSLNNGMVSLSSLENSIKSNTKAIENQTIVIGDLIATLEEYIKR
jgi:hypothetical protein